MATKSIKELKDFRATKKLAMQNIVAKESDDSPLNDEDVDSFDRLKTECDQLEARIARLTASVDPDADDADDVADDAAEKHWSNDNKTKVFNVITTNDRGHVPLKSGESAGRWLVGQWWVKEHGLRAAREMVEKKMGDDKMVAKMLTTSQPIIPQDFNPDWIELLQTKSVVRQLATTYPMPNGTMTIPRQRLGSVGTFIGEGVEITTTQLGFDNIQLQWSKYGALTYTTRELLEFTPLSAAGIIANDLTDRLALLEDRTFLYSNGGSNPYIPKGIMASVAAGNLLQNTLATGAVNFQTVAFDLEAAELQLTGNLVTGEFTWIMAPGVPAFLKQLSSTFGVFPFRDEVSRGVLNGHPIKVTSQLASNLAAALTATTTALSTASTTLTVPTNGVKVGMVISGAGISGSPTVASITSASALVASAVQTVATAVPLTFTSPTSNATNIILVKGADLIVGDAFRFAISMTTEGSFIDGSTQINTFGQDLIAFKATNAVDFALKHDVSACILQASGWSLNSVASFDNYVQAANTAGSFASSAVS
jgi:HK97 family phage major capsid protein